MYDAIRLTAASVSPEGSHAASRPSRGAPRGARRLADAVCLALLLTAAGGCALEEPLHEDHGDALPELTVAGAELGETFVEEGGLFVSPPVALETGANRVALMATLTEGARAPALLVRGVDGDVAGPWVEAAWTFEELGHLAGVGLLEDLYLEVQVALPEEAVGSFRELTFSPAFADEADLELAEPSAEAQLRDELAFVGVRPRSAWGARPHRCSTRDAGFSRMALHHTAARATGNVELALRQAQAYHMDGRGWCDIAYHYAVAQDGRVFELRPEPYRGGHTYANNAGNVGIVFVGCFDGACGNDQPTEALINAGAGIVRMMHLLHGIPVDANRVRGHRDHSHASTACPGGNLYPRLEEIRQRARSGGQPAEPPPPPPSGCGIAGPGAALAPGQALSSCNGRVSLVHQTDGNVVLYDGSHALWSTGTDGQASGTFVVQGDGNVVLYSPWGTPLWDAGTHGRVNAWLAVQDDGNLVVYQGTTPLWSTGTTASPPPPPPPPPPPAGCGVFGPGTSLAPGQALSSCDGRFVFTHQPDGNVVLYQGGAALWSTGTHGAATSALVLQGDGNLVLYSASGAALFSTGTHGNPGASLAVQDDGNVVVYAGTRPLWSTETCCR